MMLNWHSIGRLDDSKTCGRRVRQTESENPLPFESVINIKYVLIKWKGVAIVAGIALLLTVMLNC
jgi:hypothetical protein